VDSSFVISLPSLVFVCFMVGLAGFVDAAAGGGGTISLPAYMFAGMPAHFAYGCNKFSGSCGTTLSVIRFWKNKALDLKAALIAATGSFIGSAIASKIVLMLDDQILKTMLIFVIPCAALLISFKHDFGENNLSLSLTKRRAAVLACLIGFLIGGYDGLFGPGTGTFAIIAFSVLMKYDLKTASGNAKILNLASNYASLITFATAGTIYYEVAVPAAVCGVIGNYFGSGIALKKGAKFIRPMLVGVLFLLLGKMAYDILAR